VRFAILGPVELTAGGVPLPALAPRHRAVLAYLLLHAGTVISAERLTGAMWGPEPPGTARAQIQASIAAARKVLRAAGADGRLPTRPGGYVILPGPGELDLADFTAALAGAGTCEAAGDRPGAAARLREALALWRGEPLAGVQADYAASARARLQERRLSAVERLADHELALGNHAALADELAAQVEAHPLRERLTGQLVLARHRAGRPADALAAARAFRTALRDQQGLDPTRAFAALEQSILRDDAAAAPAEPPPARRRANFLPYDTPDFAGRARELDQLAPADADAVTIITVDGMAGIGKTALAVRAAHRLAGRFPGGQLFVDLQAHTAGRPPVEPAAALEVLLRQLGIPAGQIPAALAERSARWRAELAGRRVLAVLDNAASTEQVAPLLPGAAGSLVLITSRRRLTGLDGARVLTVDALPPAPAAELFGRIVGDRAAAEPAAVQDVLGLCGFLPLAVRIAAARLQHRPRWTVAYLAGRLRDQHRRLAELATGERSVEAAFTLSYLNVAPPHRRLFRLLGLHPGRDFEAHAAGALAGLTAREAEDLLEDLLDAHLLIQLEPRRYAFHDLLREHARATAAADEPAAARAGAAARLAAHYRHTAGAAVNLLYPHSAHLRERIPPPPASAPADTGQADTALADAAAAAAWLDAERANLLAVAAEPGQPELTSALASTLWRYLYGRARYDEAAVLHAAALAAARHTGDPVAQAQALVDLGRVAWRRGRYAEAAAWSAEALTVSRGAGDQRGEARAHNNLGDVDLRQGAPAAAHDHFAAAIALWRGLGDRLGEATGLINLGLARRAQGSPEAAIGHHRAALARYRELAYPGGEAVALGCLGADLHGLGRFAEARDHYREALSRHRALGNRGDEAETLNGLGEAACALADHDGAVGDHAAALALAAEAGDRPEAARAHRGLARAYAGLGRDGPAAAHDREARALTAALGSPGPGHQDGAGTGTAPA
jgi:DNA-binding SARP family transcriptional activator/tetratricopeptide (TPR) repeat protein